VGGASTTVDDNYANDLGVPENMGVGVGIISLSALGAEIPWGIFTPRLVKSGGGKRLVNEG